MGHEILLVSRGVPDCKMILIDNEITVENLYMIVNKFSSNLKANTNIYAYVKSNQTQLNIYSWNKNKLKTTLQELIKNGVDILELYKTYIGYSIIIEEDNLQYKTLDNTGFLEYGNTDRLLHTVFEKEDNRLNVSYISKKLSITKYL